MKVPTVGKCCCGCTLKTGCLIIGGCGLAVATLALIAASAFAEYLGHVESKSQEAADTLLVVRYILIVAACACVVQIVFDTCLLFGTIKGKPKYIFAWVVYCSVMLLAAIPLNIGGAIFQITHGLFENGVRTLVGMAFSAALNVYFIIVVYSHYRIVKQLPKLRSSELV